MTDVALPAPEPAERRRDSTLLTDTWVITKRGLRHMVRQPEALTDATIQPIMFVLLFAFVFGGLYVGVFTPTESAGIGAFGALGFMVLRKRATRRAVGEAPGLLQRRVDLRRRVARGVGPRDHAPEVRRARRPLRDARRGRRRRRRRGLPGLGVLQRLPRRDVPEEGGLVRGHRLDDLAFEVAVARPAHGGDELGNAGKAQARRQGLEPRLDQVLLPGLEHDAGASGDEGADVIEIGCG